MGCKSQQVADEAMQTSGLAPHVKPVTLTKLIQSPTEGLDSSVAPWLVLSQSPVLLAKASNYGLVYPISGTKGKDLFEVEILLFPMLSIVLYKIQLPLKYMVNS